MLRYIYTHIYTYIKSTPPVASEIRIYVRAVAQELMKRQLFRHMSSCRDSPAEYWKHFKQANIQSHDYIGHNYAGHDYIGHDCVGHDCI